MRLVLLALSLGLAGCQASPLERVSSLNPDVRAVVVAHVDGCTVYRLEGVLARDVAFVRCPSVQPTTTQSSSVEVCGKGCTSTVDDVVEAR